MSTTNKRVVVLSGTRFENLLTRDNFFSYNDADSMDEARRALKDDSNREKNLSSNRKVRLVHE